MNSNSLSPLMFSPVFSSLIWSITNCSILPLLQLLSSACSWRLTCQLSAAPAAGHSAEMWVLLCTNTYSRAAPLTLTPIHPPHPILPIIIHTSSSFAGTSLSVFHCCLSNRFQCKAALNHINLFSQPLNVFHHLFCQLVIFHSIPCD